MTVKTGGRIRGIISRWLVRFDASQDIFRIAFLAITAGSTLTTALELIGFGAYTPYVLASCVAFSPIFAYTYVETGIYNRKNRERMDRGDNFAAPGMYMGSSTTSVAIAAAIQAVEDNENPEKAAQEAVTKQWLRFRDGMDVENIGENGDV